MCGSFMREKIHVAPEEEFLLFLLLGGALARGNVNF